MATSISETKFAALKNKLRELFELDKSDLDFGIYRIMAARNKEVTAFLDRELKDTVREVLQEHSTAQSTQLQSELDKATEGAKALGMDPESVPKVQELREKVKAAGGGSVEELEADIYNHLLAFFSRYYDEGDFISKRYYKGDTYAIPYNGEEVTLHWANKDQYYTKSGEWHKDYRFSVDGRLVRFNLVTATQETNNNKETAESKRRYILTESNPIVQSELALTLNFQFRAPTEEEKQRVNETEVTRIFGGKFDAGSSRTKGDEREQFCADAEIRAIQALSSDWQSLLSQVIETEPHRTCTTAKPNRTLLGKHLDRFTARNAFDYFIHKDLFTFLKRELDSYIKSDIVRLDDLEALDTEHLARVQGKVRAVRHVAIRIIRLLSSAEDFQKRLWLKKKFVLNTNWLISVDRIPEDLRATVVANSAQWTEWERLGFRPPEMKSSDLPSINPKWGTREYLDANDRLPVDTRFFDRSFTFSVLSDSHVLGSAKSLEAAITGLLIHGDNFQALRLLKPTYTSRINYIYVDPPYNTDSAPIVYKNGYRSSSWISLIADRLQESLPLLRETGVKTVAIDDTEMCHLSQLLSEHASGFRLSRITVVHNPKGSITTDFNRVHEYAFFLTRSERAIARTMEENEKPRKMRRWGENSLRVDRRLSFYPIYVRDGQIVRIGEVPADDFHPEARGHFKTPSGITSGRPGERSLQRDGHVFHGGQASGVGIESN